jgi:hypothetical protein
VKPEDSPHGKIAFKFASLLFNGDFDSAYQMLSKSAQAEWSSATLATTYNEMVEYFQGEVIEVQVITTLEDWPDKQPDDIGWAYAAIIGDGDSEAVTVVACNEDGRDVVRSIEWGRP